MQVEKTRLIISLAVRTCAAALSWVFDSCSAAIDRKAKAVSLAAMAVGTHKANAASVALPKGGVSSTA